MNIKLTKELIHKLPKTDLHVHLDGSVRIQTILELAEEENISLPTKDAKELSKLIVCGDHTESLDDYLRGFDIVNRVLQSKTALRRAAFELAEDAAKENIRYIEVRYSPILHTQKGLKLTEISQAVIDGLKDAERAFKIKTGVIICGIRNMDPMTSLKLAELAIAFKNKGVIGFDLAGGEYNHPAKDHKEAFDLALRNNLNITIHAGEAYGPESIHQAKLCKRPSHPAGNLHHQQLSHQERAGFEKPSHRLLHQLRPQSYHQYRQPHHFRHHAHG
jgi:adenosine deaminase